MKSLWWITYLFLIAPLLAESASITIRSRWSGLSSKGNVKELANKTLRFRCSPSIEASRSTQCIQFAAVIKATKSAARNKPNNWLGITPEWLAANVDQAIQKDLRDLAGAGLPSLRQIALFRASFLDPQTLVGIEFFRTDDYPNVHVEVRSRKGLDAEFTSASQAPLMAPWSVRLGSETFEAHDGAIGEALCPLLADKFPNRSRICGTYLRYLYSERIFYFISNRWRLAK